MTPWEFLIQALREELQEPAGVLEVDQVLPAPVEVHPDHVLGLLGQRQPGGGREPALVRRHPVKSVDPMGRVEKQGWGVSI